MGNELRMTARETVMVLWMDVIHGKGLSELGGINNPDKSGVSSVPIELLMATNNATKELIIMTIMFRYSNIKDLIDENIILIRKGKLHYCVVTSF